MEFKIRVRDGKMKPQVTANFVIADTVDDVVDKLREQGNLTWNDSIVSISEVKGGKR